MFAVDKSERTNTGLARWFLVPVGSSSSSSRAQKAGEEQQEVGGRERGREGEA